MKNLMNVMRRLWQLGWLRVGIQLVFFAIIGYFMVRYISAQWEQIDEAPPKLNIPLLIVAQLGVLISMGIQPFGTWLIIRGLGGNLSKPQVWQAFFLGQIAKYLPGSLWSLPSRGFLYNQRGLEGQRSIETVIWETGLAVVAATLVGILTIPLLLDSIYLPLIMLEIGGFSAVFSLASILLRQRGFNTWLRKHIPFAKSLLAIFPYLSPKIMLQALGLYIVQWVIMGASFVGIVLALGADLSALETLQTIGLFPCVWAVGLLIIITPGGIGIREALITIALGNIVNDPLPLYAAVIARLCWTAAEVVNIVLSSLAFGQEKRQLATLAPTAAGLRVETSGE